ncbi:TonB-dependent receptor [Oceanicoccus sagamiensis]|uniref:Uncharacterized protein n=1 Tax=Oceanicoccus sagamiensis TaxID=716816 RepID=A0A1X9NK17_9GAMM|nr:TonB-dependent receptor [Oceanicoccus sagamiensis]ARN76175.1 hypothetical protein BST96_19965 [Oceanicoccus sagamiensis]
MRLQISVILLLLFLGSNYSLAVSQLSPTGKHSAPYTIEEVVVTAQKREELLQEVPIAISVLSEQQLLQQGISSLSDLLAGTVTSLNINPYAASPSTLVMAIRGNGPGDVATPSRDTSVAVYLDEIYLGRGHGLNFELAELERIEVLRGPQGTLYGRNATAGAINLVSKRPAGEFGIRQGLELGSDNLQSHDTHIDLPLWAGIATKIDYLHTERDGWVNNTAPGEHDYNAYDKDGYRISFDFNASDNLILGYTYNDSDTEVTQVYYQFYIDNLGLFGDEGGRQSKTRFPVSPLEPTRSEQQFHSFSVDWALSDSLNFLSLSSYRELEDKTRNNWAGSAYFNGLVEVNDMDQQQFSQEFRFWGRMDRLDWVAGVYYFEEETDESLEQFFSLDVFGLITGTPLTPIVPITNYDVFIDAVSPARMIETELESTSIYGQATWTPPVLDDQLEITLGARYTHENKSGARTSGEYKPFSVSDNDQTDPSITFNYHWTETISTYAKWSNAHRSGGINSRSRDLVPHEHEEVELIELGMKLQGWDNRLIINTALFSTDYEGMFIDIFDPNDLTISETINSSDTVTVEGAEVDLVLQPLAGLTLGLSYTYLNGDFSPQPNPLANNAPEKFLLTQTPQHVGAVTVDYEWPRFKVGLLTGHLDVVSSSDYNHWYSGGKAHPDGYLLVNARAELAEIPLSSGDYGQLSLAVWGKNLTDEEYVVSSFNFEVSVVHAYGEPRSAGVAIRYEY